MNAIERLREATDESCDYSCGCDSHGDPAMCVHGERYAALAVVEALYQAAKARGQRGHNDTCSYELDDEKHSNGYVCDCGADALAAAVRRVEGEPRAFFGGGTVRRVEGE